MGSGKVEAERFSFCSGHGAVGLDSKCGFSAAGGHRLLALFLDLNCELPFQDTMP